MGSRQPTLEERLQELRDAYAAQLPTKLNELFTLWSLLNNEDWDWDIAQDVYRHAHTLAGSAPTFGFDEVGKIARQIEKILKKWITDHQQPSSEACDALSVMVSTLTTPEN